MKISEKNKKATNLFTQPNLDRVSAAVKEAEKRTSGEIVPYVVEQSDLYEEAEWRGGVLMGVAALVVLVLRQRVSASWLQPDLVQALLVFGVAFLVGALIVRYVPICRRFCAGRNLIDRRVHQRATEAFVSEEVFKTRDRTGVLIFMSLLEHKVVVVGDVGINAKVKQIDWEEVVQLVIAGIRSGKPADGLIQAIMRCGDLLQREGVAVSRSDTDELPDNLRQGEFQE